MSDSEVLYVRSSKKNSKKSTEGDSSTNEDDIWDDTLLIKAYDKAVQLAQQNCLRQQQIEASGKFRRKGDLKWKVGDRCRCQYSEDLKFYEADIMKIFGSSGLCLVRYVGYENEEEVPLAKLKPSGGDCARNKQYREALEEFENDSSPDNYSGTNSNRDSPSIPQDLFKKRNGVSDTELQNSLSFPAAQLGSPMIPPPPPPHVFSKLSEIENEGEAMSAMLMSWYMSGFHTGYYQGLKMAKKQ